jgi:hypothetical protein
MDDFDMPRQIALAVVYAEEYLIQLEATVAVGRWAGQARAYTTPEELRRFADALAEFGARLAGEAALEAGAENGIGLVALRFYTTDRARHVACHVRLASQTATEHRPEQVSRLAVEARVEPPAVAAFARQLAGMARSRSGQAALVTEIPAG